MINIQWSKVITKSIHTNFLFLLTFCLSSCTIWYVNISLLSSNAWFWDLLKVFWNLLLFLSSQNVHFSVRNRVVLWSLGSLVFIFSLHLEYLEFFFIFLSMIRKVWGKSLTLYIAKSNLQTLDAFQLGESSQ